MAVPDQHAAVASAVIECLQGRKYQERYIQDLCNSMYVPELEDPDQLLNTFNTNRKLTVYILWC